MNTPSNDTNPPQTTAPAVPQRLTRDQWTHQRDQHHARVDALLAVHLEFKAEGRKHPVLDFLCEYYSFKFARLRRWTPGFGVVLEGATRKDFKLIQALTPVEGGLTMKVADFPARRRRSAGWIRGMLDATRRRPPQVGCFGLHEWAMVYKSDDIRHSKENLRMEPEALARFVESRQLICTHYDAFRFFTPAAAPLNHHQPSFETMDALEQPGCLHANMDLYRWSYKIYPWIDSAIILDAFELAMDARRIDMQASPYDMTPYGLEPIKIETQEGRRHYQTEQTRISQRAAPLRDRLVAAYDLLLDAFKAEEAQDTLASA